MAVITSDITSSTSIYATVTAEAWKGEGVVLWTMSDWTSQHYLMGIQTSKLKWKRWRFRRVNTPVSNPGALADWAVKYEGKAYCSWHKFPFAKWHAPDSFICTTLVWWCAKKAYEIDISTWYSTPLLTPANLYNSSNVYLIKTEE